MIDCWLCLKDCLRGEIKAVKGTKLNRIRMNNNRVGCRNWAAFFYRLEKIALFNKNLIRDAHEHAIGYIILKSVTTVTAHQRRNAVSYGVNSTFDLNSVFIRIKPVNKRESVIYIKSLPPMVKDKG